MEKNTYFAVTLKSMKKKILKWVGVVLLTPIALLILIAALLYFPPFQNFAAHKAAEYASEKYGMKVSIENIHLAFPLNLRVKGVEAISKKDTVLDVENLNVSIQMLPLFKKRVELDGAELIHAKVNTLNLVKGMIVKGRMGYFYIDSHGINLDPALAVISNVKLNNSDLSISITDTTTEKKKKEENLWKVKINKIDIGNCRLLLHMPLSKMNISLALGNAKVRKGFMDLRKKAYKFNLVEAANSAAAYDMTNESRMKKGLDYYHLNIRDINLKVDSIYYCGNDIAATIRKFAMKEKSGLDVKSLTGHIKMDAKRISLPDLILTTANSFASTESFIDWNSLEPGKGGNMNISLLAQIGKGDLALIPQGIPQTFFKTYPNLPLILNMTVRGNMDRLSFFNTRMRMPGALSMQADGYITNVTDSLRRTGTISFNAETQNTDFILAYVDSTNAYKIPAGTKLNGKASFRGTQYATECNLKESEGSAFLNAAYDMKGDRYKAKMNINNLQIHHFMPKDSLFHLTAAMEIEGKGVDFYSPRTTLNAHAKVDKIEYGSISLKDMEFTANMLNGLTNVDFNSHDPYLDLQATLTASIKNKTVLADLTTEMRKADWYRMHASSEPLTTAGNLSINLQTDFKKIYHVKGLSSQLKIVTAKQTFSPKDINLVAFTTKDSTFANAHSGDLSFNFNGKGNLWTIMKKGTSFANELMKEVDNKYLDQNKLKTFLPNLCINIKSGKDNPISNWLSMNGISFKDFFMDIDTSPQSGINGVAHLYKLKTDSLTLDTIRFTIVQDTAGVKYKAQVCNAPTNKQFVFNALADGKIYHKGADLNLLYFDDKQEKGVDMGLKCEMYDDGWTFYVTPEHPYIAYNTFNVNSDQYVFIRKDGKIYANLNLLDNNGMGVKIHSNPLATTFQDVSIQLCKLNMQAITNVIPYTPSITGTLDAEVKFHQLDKNNKFEAEFAVKNMTYENSPMGNLSMSLLYLPSEKSEHIVNLELKKDDKKIAEISGSYIDKEKGIVNGDITFQHFPMNMVNGFIPDDMCGFRGDIDGKVSMKGSMDRPEVNGEIQLDSVGLYSDVYGVDFRFTDDPVRIINSNLLFENFDVYAVGDNPFTVQGNLNFANMDHIWMDLQMRARNYQLLDSKRKYNSVLFGKVFANFNATLKGPLDDLKMRGSLSVLGNTDVTYIMKDTPLTVEDRLSDLVTFTSFDDSTNYVAPKTEPKPAFNGLDMNMALRIDQGTQMNVELSSNKQSYINVEGGGNMTMRYTPQGDLKLSGRYTLNRGEMRYELPVIPLKTFTLGNGSYIEFTGDPYNPKLNLSASEKVKATVTEGEQPRTVAFEVGVAISNTLKKMGLAFTLNAPEDATIQNQLASMSESERGKLAVTMLATGMYLAEGNSGNFNMNNALNSFLESEISNIAGSALKTIDISVGMEDNTSSTGKTSTDYSFRFAKRLWGNRLSVVIGGKVSSGNDVSNKGQSFIDDVSLEYRLDTSGTRYVRIFNNKNYDSMLDGEITETGGGVVLRKKMTKFGELFIFRNKRRNSEAIEEKGGTRKKGTTARKGSENND